MQRLLLTLPSIVLAVGCSQPNQYQAPPPPDVTVARPIISTVTNYLDETGTTEAVERVEVRARVRGFLEEVRFQDGDEVKAGAPLYLIQPSEHQAAFNAAEANLATTNADVNAAKADVDATKVALVRAGLEVTRQENLFKDNATAESKVQTALAERDGAAAAVAAAEANVGAAIAAVTAATAAKAQAKLDLDYCTITAPIDGRVERTLVKIGNLVGDSEATHLTTMISYDPIHVYFNISERSLLRARSSVKDKSQERPDISSIKAYLRRAIDKEFPFEGNLDYFDLGVDQSTGTFTVRAVFPNETRDIMPGLFVRIRVPIGTTENAVLLPERCVAVDQAGRFVMILDDKNVVERRNVTLGEKHGEMVVITDGLDGKETVVIDGIQKARPGATMTPKEITLDASSIEADGSRAAAEIVPDEAEADTPDADPTAAEPSPENSDAANTSPPSDASDK
ncbi:MAG TPA: efflux RND transporter periplasmic adaptor subunit [Planctomycetes bacterium]|nr:efflux RND transporter periplasmic adaptor subunit [Fuerstiella sp.]HIK91374.1 efflux RND transporter periplasmic adaptor subunit [Planctomycetota bacterium]